MARILCKAVGGRLLSVSLWMIMEGIQVARTLNKATKKIGGQFQGNVDNNDLRAECTLCGTRMTGGKILEEAVVYIFSKRPWKRSEDDMMDH